MGIIKLGDIFDKEEKGHEYSGIFRNFMIVLMKTMKM